jgi:hypothetical protein
VFHYEQNYMNMLAFGDSYDLYWRVCLFIVKVKVENHLFDIGIYIHFSNVKIYAIIIILIHTYIHTTHALFPKG